MRLGSKDVELPLVPAKLAQLVRGAEPAPPAGRAAERDRASGAATGVCAAKARRASARRPSASGPCCSIPATLQAVIPGCHNVQKISDTHFRADVTIGVGPVKGRYRADVKLSDLDPPHAVTLGGSAEGALGFGSGEGRITLVPTANGGTAIRYVYEAAIGGKVASIGGRLLDGAARVIIGQFFAALARQAGGGAAASLPSFLACEAASPVRRAAMKPAAFDYVRAEHLDEALDVLGREGSDARIIAGGQSLMAMLNMRLAKPRTLIDIMRLAELARIETTRRHDQGRRRGPPGIAAGMAGPCPRVCRLVALALPWTGHVQTRSRGTICGSIAHADPSAELPLALQALGGEVHLRSAKPAPAGGGEGFLRRHDGNDARR